ncbi:hypothetical protein N7532_010510 [Penicillium argentinense]|uniref:Phosphoglycerate mutase n=1 Tax=Penicillium argentinense TaxID=1131581 RepID=A0A9W9JXQ5_9EURO|nr:uncharacterized protein N7532_010510 [Penicillium argentinense]KAJ5085739.1 hypothetical protein N7532_010510 [Penicillium argentinense]
MPYLHLIRHAEATHNPNHDTTIPDPPLTATGIQQSKQLNEDFPYHKKVGLMITSPLRRAVQTALIGFESCLEGRYYDHDTVNGDIRSNTPKGERVTLRLEPEIQAHSSRLCDTGSTPLVLQSEFPSLLWDEIELGRFPAKEGDFVADMENLERRGGRVKDILRNEFQSLRMRGGGGGRILLSLPMVNF